MNQDNAYRNYLLKPATMAGVVAAGSAIWRPGGQVLIPGSSTTVPLPLVAAGATFLAAEAAALMNAYLFNHIPVISAMEAPAHTLVNIGTVMAGTAAVENYVSPGLVGDLGLAELGAMSALSEVTSTYIVDQYLMPMWNKYAM